jgi:ATP-dependent Lon protease
MPKGNSDAKPKSKPSYKTRNNKKNKLRRSKDDSDSDEDISLGDDYEEDEDDDDDDEDYETCSDTSESEYIPVTKKKNNKIVIGNDDDEDDDDDVDEDVDDEEDGDENDPEYRRKFKKFLYEIFPSKYMKKKIESEEEQEEEEEPKRRKSKSQSKTKSKSKRRVEEEQEEDEGEEDEEEEEDERGKVVDILFYGGQGDYVDPEEYDEEDDKGDCDSDDERAFMKENYETIAMPVKSEEKEKKQKKGKKKAVVSDEESDIADVEDDYLDLIETKKTLTQQLNKRPKSKILIHAIDECNRSIKKLVKKARIRNAKAYHKMIHDDKQNTNEIDFFKKKLSNKEQLKVMKELKEINAHMNIDRPYRLALLESKIPAKFKAIALQKLNTLRHMEPGDNEYYKIKNWVDTFMRVPFYNNQNLSITIDDGIEKCHDFMQNAMTILDSCVYGLNDAKLQILQMVGQWISNPSAMGTAIAIKGPMGTGKTTLVKEGISKILGREFAFIALGGAGDSSFLEGHSYTYEGSSWGKIVQILIDSKCMNPVIYFDELDKISDTPRGEEIVGILTHLTDTSQNSQFHDKYFSDIDFDLSKCLFIFSYNDESKVNSILKDRMYRIQTKGYDAKEKITIARNYILPKIREQVNFNDSDVIIPDDTIQYIVTNEALTHGEDGVRNLKRCLEIIYTKLNLFRLVKPDTENIFAKEINIKVSFPFTVTRKDVDVFIKNEQSHNQSMLAMYC